MTTNSERNFYTGITLAIAVGVFVGFAQTFYLRPMFPEAAEFAAPERFFYYHGAVFTAWIVLIVAQAFLIRSRNVALHRKLGTVGVGLAVVLVVIGIYGALLAANRPGGFIGIPMDPAAFLIVPVLDMVLFGLFVGLAVYWRDRPQAHKRLMVLATLSIAQAAFVRIWPPFLGEFAGPIMQMLLTFLLISAMVAWDLRTTRRLHPATLWAGIPLFISQPLRIPLGETDAWTAIGHWMMRLV